MNDLIENKVGVVYETVEEVAMRLGYDVPNQYQQGLVAYVNGVVGKGCTEYLMNDTDVESAVEKYCSFRKCSRTTKGFASEKSINNAVNSSFPYYNDIRVENREGKIWVSLTDMGNAAAKRVENYTRRKKAKEFFSEMEESLGCTVLESCVGGSRTQNGTWAIEVIAIDFAAWCSISFKEWLLSQFDLLKAANYLSLSFVRRVCLSLDETKNLSRINEAMELYLPPKTPIDLVKEQLLILEKFEMKRRQLVEAILVNLTPEMTAEIIGENLYTIFIKNREVAPFLSGAKYAEWKDLPTETKTAWQSVARKSQQRLF